MGFLDDIVAQQSGGGMLGGLPAAWQYQNPDTLSPAEKQMMALVGTQNPAQAGFTPLPASPGAFPAPLPASPNDRVADAFGALPPPASPNDRVASAFDALPQSATPNDRVADAFSALPPPAAFGAGASPIFAMAPGSTPGNPALPSAAPMVKPPVVASDDEEDATPIAIGKGYQMPRIGPAAAFTPDPAALPVNAQQTQGQGLPGQDATPSIGDKLMAGYQNLHHGGGLIGSIVAAVTGKRNDPSAVATQQQSQIANMTARALVNKGISQDLAIAAVQPGNGEFLKTLIAQAFGPKTIQSLGDGYVADKDGNIRRVYTPEQKDNFVTVQTGENGMGGKTFQKMNKATGEMTPIAGGGDSAVGGALGDLSKTGDEYLATVPKERQGILRGMVDGTIQPPTSFAASKPYWQTMLASAKQLDPTFDENSWNARRKMATDLASSSNSSMGGILSNGGSAFKHLAEYTKSAADLGNASHNFIGGGKLAYAQNWIANESGGSDTQGKIKALKDNLSHYGQESTKFYAGTGGGVEERMHALKEMNPSTTSGEEAAAYAEKEKSLMTDRLYSKLQEIRHTYGEEQGNRIIAKHLPEIEKTIATIDANIAKLRGEKSADAPATALPSLKVGESTTVNGVSIKKVSDAQAGK
jgi:hypothetical protein